MFYLRDCAINIIIVLLFSNALCSASTLLLRPPPVWQGQPYFPHTSASLPPCLHRLCFLPLCGNFWSVIPRSLRPLPVVFPRGLRRCQSWARLQSAKYFAIDLTDARRRLSFFFCSGSSPQRPGASLVSDLLHLPISERFSFTRTKNTLRLKKEWRSRTFGRHHNINGSC